MSFYSLNLYTLAVCFLENVDLRETRIRLLFMSGSYSRSDDIVSPRAVSADNRNMNLQSSVKITPLFSHLVLEL